ncbi:glycosyltransferase [Chitinispirillales bacterium ANBcel5]|uniref:glycosyltransferase n=1 Tax=Cellulosispirillum alkaliphilum TaxID=3039283 RepID=UPI002A501367|nr:glycosyltransferase [Chitinispirillales bacterium ANBcel5]
MISVVVSARNPVPGSPLERNIKKTIGTENELLIIKNSGGEVSLSSVYNFGLSKAKGEIVVFMHDDLFFMRPDWGLVLQDKFLKNPYLGVVGLAGTQYLHADNYSWTSAGRPYLKGQLLYHFENGDFFATLFSDQKGDFEVVCCTGVFMAVRSEVFASARFDEDNFDDFYFHDLDFCMQVRNNWRIMVTTDILAKHCSPGSFGKQYHLYGSRFMNKHLGSLPASCAETSPDSDNYVPVKCVNLKGKMSHSIIV